MIQAKHLVHTQLEAKKSCQFRIDFLVVALMAALLGFDGIAGVATDIAKVLFIIFIVLFLISFITGLVRR
jgi:uncharacterized membrane protein YtjA (UPF0391 family)